MCSQPATIAPTTTDDLRELLISYTRHSTTLSSTPLSITPLPITSQPITPLSIAIVGNAPMPPDPARAAAIDGADLVVRMTSFALDTPGQPPSLGRSCDVVALHRGVVASPHTFADYTSRLYLLVEPGRLHWEPETVPPWWPDDLGFVPVPNWRYTVPMLRLLGLDETQAVWPTTGSLITYVLTELFPTATVLLTGMSIVDEPDQVTFHHAWGDPVQVTPEHRLSAEADLLRRWHASGRIRILP